MRIYLGWLTTAWCLILSAGSTLATEQEAVKEAGRNAALIERAASRIKAENDGLRRFSCSEQVKRSFFTNSGSVLAWQDRFVLTFGVFEGRQLFSWPGFGRLRYEDPSALIGEGPISSGEFGPFAINIFLAGTDPHTFQFVSYNILKGFRVAEFAYEVPVEVSRFEIGLGRGRRRAITGFRGVISVDATTSEVRRLVVDIPEPPHDSGIADGHIEIDYKKREIGGGGVLLPIAATMKLTSITRDVSVNETQYDECRQLSAESSVSFDDPAESKVSSHLQAEDGYGLPAGLNILTKVLSSIDAAKSHAGDEVQLRMTNPLKLGKSVLAPKGTVITGRLLHLKRQFVPRKESTVQIMFEYMDMAGRRVPISLASLGPPTVYALERSHPRPAVDPHHIAEITTYGDYLRIKSGSLWAWQTR